MSRRNRAAVGAVALLLAGSAVSLAAGTPRAAWRAAYAILEGDRINIYARDARAGCSREQLLVSEESMRGNARPGHIFMARISPAGDRIAYSPRYTPDGRPDGRVFLVDGWGRGRVQILERADELVWSPDGTRIAYGVYGPEPPELPVEPVGPDWHVLDLERGRQETLAPEEADRLFERAADLFRGNARIRVSPTGARTVMVGSTMERTCEVLEVRRASEPGDRLLHHPHHECGDLQWNTDDEFFFGMASVPEGAIPVKVEARHGYFANLSVRKYSFRSRSEHTVIESDNDAVYRFQGVLPGHGLVVSNESAHRAPRYILELRRLDGSRPLPIRSSDQEILFLGWLR